jgi:WD40 repeat protein
VEIIEDNLDLVNSVAFSPDSQALAAGGFPRTIILWDVATSQPLGESLKGHTTSVLSVTFSPDGQTLASGSQDSTIILWDVTTRQPLGSPLIGYPEPVLSVAFSPDGKTLASGGQNGAIILWDVSFESWQARACSIANRNLTQAEWDKFIGPNNRYKRTCKDWPAGEGAPSESPAVTR